MGAFTVRAAMVAVVCAAALAGCGSSADVEGAGEPTVKFDPGEAAPPTPLSDEIIKAAKDEGALLIYTNGDEESMKPLVDGFETAFPGIKVSVISLGSAEVVQRYRTERATGTPSAGVLISTDGVAMRALTEDGKILDYEDPNLVHLRDDAELAPGVVALSMDPMIAMFNKALLPVEKQPKSLAEFAEMAPSMKGKIGTTDISNPVQLAATSGYIDATGDKGWETLGKLGSNAGVESGNAAVTQKLLKGAYTAGFFLSGTLRPHITGDVAKVLNYTYFSDVAMVIPRGMGITADAPAPNAAKLFVNYALSVKGQEAGCAGGFTPYRSGVKCEYALSAVRADEESLKVAGWASDFSGKKKATVSRWNAAFGR
ncbi:MULTISPECIES: ABC transporter substrate-binding protein [unclassified Spirillospora]|uniref:ABC transporter substrate-binding protein n=1 Tax=unclassified Spirillospora TaxID=2642701 RepID=UPI00371FE160